MDYTAIDFSVRQAIAHIRLNRPAAANSIDLALARELHAAALHCEEDPAVRAVLISGAGRLFCAGGDLKSFSGYPAAERPIRVKEVTTFFHAAISRLAHMDSPVIAAVHGSAAGAGFSLICACDLVIATESARFAMAYTRHGLTPDGSASYFLPRLVGLRRAMELTLTNRVLSAAEAQQWGIVTRVVPDEELMTAAGTLAEKMVQGPTRAFGVAKRLMVGGLSAELESQMEAESRAIAQAVQGPESREGIAAFLEKRTPRFKSE